MRMNTKKKEDKEEGARLCSSFTRVLKREEAARRWNRKQHRKLQRKGRGREEGGPTQVEREREGRVK